MGGMGGMGGEELLRGGVVHVRLLLQRETLQGGIPVLLSLGIKDYTYDRDFKEL